jgi:hypothetical protein
MENRKTIESKKREIREKGVGTRGRDDWKGGIAWK